MIRRPSGRTGRVAGAIARSAGQTARADPQEDARPASRGLRSKTAAETEEGHRQPQPSPSRTQDEGARQGTRKPAAKPEASKNRRRIPPNRRPSRNRSRPKPKKDSAKPAPKPQPKTTRSPTLIDKQNLSRKPFEVCETSKGLASRAQPQLNLTPSVASTPGRQAPPGAGIGSTVAPTESCNPT